MEKALPPRVPFPRVPDGHLKEGPQVLSSSLPFGVKSKDKMDSENETLILFLKATKTELAGWEDASGFSFCLAAGPQGWV